MFTMKSNGKPNKLLFFGDKGANKYLTVNS